LAGDIHRRLATSIRAGALGADGTALDALRVTLSQSQVAWGAFDAPLNDGAR